jgi:hypothetical protein
MRLTVAEVGMNLFRGVNIVHQKMMIFRMRCMAHRLICFGWEDFINEYTPRELMMLAALMFDQQHYALIREAYARGDDELRAWINGRFPGLMAEVAA